ncbi:hypothetical protein EJ04DRAFT_510694 [Polyplosphaeria fusca]|uniref:Fungal N-terminal domain-containing protein n=1 Tax=Polyplosphaeria fusca TaxID=682080 RepID=A0A9P4R4R1_9PLEO|nr:hypothetical protein EJ04DRAFT_510694 [Polyplosphaeria fusca]
MTAIPSVGDILLLSQLAWKIGRAFTAGRTGAPPEFLDVETEINGLAKALKLLAEALFNEADEGLLQQANPQTQRGVGAILTSCQRSVHDLDSLMDQYQVIKKHRTPGGFAIERSWSHLVLAQYQSMTWTAEEGTIRDLRDMLRMHTSTLTLTMQAIQSKSMSRLDDVVTPMAATVERVHDKSARLSEQLEEMHRIVIDIAGHTPPPPELTAEQSMENRPPSSLYDDLARRTSPKPESYSVQQYFPPARQNSNDFYPVSSPSLTAVPSSPTETATITSASTSPTITARKRISEFSYGGSTNRYSSSYASSEASTSTGWPSPTPNRDSQLSRSSSKRDSHLPKSPNYLPNARPESTVLPSLPPPAMDMDEDMMDHLASLGRLSLNPPTQPEYVKLHRSATTTSQEKMFEKDAFRNAAILCDVRGRLVEYTQKVASDNDDVEMVSACENCRIAVVRKREFNPDKSVHMMTSIWVFSDDNTVRMELKMADGEMYVPYSSYFTPEKISITVKCELKFHDVKYGARPARIARTHWINYIFEDEKGAILFQNELMGRTLLGTYRTEKTLRIHEGLSGAFAYQEQMCGMENLRIWEDNDTGAVIAMIHFSAHFKMGYLAFYLNSSNSPIRIKEYDSREIKIKGLKVPLEKGALRKDSVSGKKDGADGVIDKKKIISGAKVEFATDADKRDFLALWRDVQMDLLELPDLMGVN